MSGLLLYRCRKFYDCATMQHHYICIYHIIKQVLPVYSEKKIKIIRTN